MVAGVLLFKLQLKGLLQSAQIPLKKFIELGGKEVGSLSVGQGNRLLILDFIEAQRTDQEALLEGFLGLPEDSFFMMKKQGSGRDKGFFLKRGWFFAG